MELKLDIQKEIKGIKINPYQASILKRIIENKCKIIEACTMYQHSPIVEIHLQKLVKLDVILTSQYLGKAIPAIETIEESEDFYIENRGIVDYPSFEYRNKFTVYFLSQLIILLNKFHYGDGGKNDFHIIRYTSLITKAYKIQLCESI